MDEAKGVKGGGISAIELGQEDLLDYVQNSAVALHWVDANGIIKWANTTELNMLGYTAEEYIGQPIWNFHADQEVIQDILARLKRNETLNRYEACLRCRDGSLKTVQISSNVLWKDGKFIHSRCFTVDITQQKFFFTSLKESEFKYRQLITGLPAAVYTCDADGFLTLFNEAAAELWGRRPELNVDMWCGSWKIFRPDGSPLPLESCPMSVALKEARAVHGEEIIVQRPDGAFRHVLPHPRPLFGNSGALIGAVNMLVDITEIRKSEQVLRESENRFRAAADASPVFIWLSDRHGERYFFNKSWIDFTGRPLAEQTGFGWTKSVHADDLPQLLKFYNTAPGQQQEYKMEYRLLRNDGQYRWILSQGIARYHADGAFDGFTGTCVDIHEQKQFNEALEEQIQARTTQLKKTNERLLRYTDQLEQFNYVASHDMKEPLRKVIFFNNFILGSAAERLNEKELDYLGRSISAGKRMQDLIEDLLEYSRSTSESQPYEVIALGELINEVQLLHQQTLEETGGVIQAGDLPVIHGVRFQIRQLFDNVIGNALKYRSDTRRPVIRIHTALADARELATLNVQDDQSYHKISVVDNGIGFEAGYAEKIFEIFERLHSRTEFTGTGIGLAICKRVVENHNGFIRATAAIDQGARFDIYLPVNSDLPS